MVDRKEWRKEGRKAGRVEGWETNWKCLSEIYVEGIWAKSVLPSIGIGGRLDKEDTS